MMQYRAYKSESGTWNVERYSATSNVVKTVAFRLTKEEALAKAEKLSYREFVRAFTENKYGELA